MTAPSIAYGTMALTSVYNAHADFSEAERALRLALDRGVRTLHTAAHYGDGRAFELIASLDDHPAWDELEIIAKIDGAPSRVLGGVEGVRNTLVALGRPKLDRMQLVESRPELDDHMGLEAIMTQLETGGPLAEIVEALRAEDVVGEVGIEAYDFEQARRALEIPEIDFVVCDMSAMRQVIPLDAVPPRVADGRVKIVAIRPLAGGWLTPRYRRLDDFPEHDNRREWYALAEHYRGPVEATFERLGVDVLEGSLRFLHSISFLDTIVVGMRTVAQVEAALDPRMKVPLPREVVEELVNLFPQPVTVEVD